MFFEYCFIIGRNEGRRELDRDIYLFLYLELKVGFYDRRISFFFIKGKI